MIKELEKYFGCKVITEEYERSLSLPIFMAMRKIVSVSMFEVKFIVIDISKEEDISVSAMKKQLAKYEEATNALVAYNVTINSLQMRNALIKNNIPFIDLPSNIFLPFLGMILQNVYKEQKIKTDKMMPATQMLFLQLLYQKESACILKSEAAKLLHLTKTSITRATSQLDKMGLIKQVKKGTEIWIQRNASRRDYFEKAKDFMINPIQKTITVKWEPEFEWVNQAGESALSMYSSLNPPEIREIAVYKGEELVEQLELVDPRIYDKSKCVKIQLWKYDPTHFIKKGMVDPASLICSFKGNTDERIEMCTEEVLEELG